MKDRCTAQVKKRGMGFYRTHQCNRPAVQDGFCPTHHPDQVSMRLIRRDMKEERRRKDRMRHHFMLGIGMRVLEIVEKQTGRALDPEKEHPAKVVEMLTKGRG